MWVWIPTNVLVVLVGADEVGLWVRLVDLITSGSTGVREVGGRRVSLGVSIEWVVLRVGWRGELVRASVELGKLELICGIGFSGGC